MSRSLKKKPYVEKKLFNRVVAMNESGKKQVIKMGTLYCFIISYFINRN